MRRHHRGDADVFPGRAVKRAVEAERLATPDIDTAMKEAQLARPKVRSDCAGGPRPCPFASCRYSLLVEIGHGGMLRVTFPKLELEERKETCALDVADRGGVTLETVAQLLGVTRERVRQVEERGLAMFRRRGESLKTEGDTP